MARLTLGDQVSIVSTEEKAQSSARAMDSMADRRTYARTDARTNGAYGRAYD